MKDTSTDFIFDEALEALAPNAAELIQLEEKRQLEKLIMIPSESCAPQAVREALGSVFQNIYAEGYPRKRTVSSDLDLLAATDFQTASYVRYGDRRFYKGTEFANLVEATAGRKAASLFATDTVPSSNIRANVQALSGSAANLAIYDALLEDGDLIMGMDLFQGGHLTHGSEFNQSGKRYKVVSYGINPETEQLDYSAIQALVEEHRPKLIVAGFTSYPWAPDWKSFRAIADSVNAFLMADISHTAGLVIGGVYPNPVGIADVTMFTTHKTLTGPRGAVILSTNGEIAEAVDTAVFPGAQGGPHLNKMAALCVALSIAGTEKFRELQKQIVLNAAALSDAFQREGVRVVYKGTDTHIILVDATVPGREEGETVYGEIAARLLEIAGIVVNKNTIPGDSETAMARGLRFGTPWVTQRGLKEEDMAAIARAVAGILSCIKPFTYNKVGGTLPRGKIDPQTLETCREEVGRIVERIGYRPPGGNSSSDDSLISVSGFRAEAFLQGACTRNMAPLDEGDTLNTLFIDGSGDVICGALITREKKNSRGMDCFTIQAPPSNRSSLSRWLQGLSTGYTLFDGEDIYKKIEGPVVISEGGKPNSPFPKDQDITPGTPVSQVAETRPELFDPWKPYFIGSAQVPNDAGSSAVRWTWREDNGEQPKKTLLFEKHKELGGKLVPFAGYEMPVWYSSNLEEHKAVRTAAGLFDVSHMGCFEVSGPQAEAFLDTVISNYAAFLEPGESCYGYLLDTEGDCLDDLMLYRLERERFIMVVNAANEEKDWDWLEKVNRGEAVIDSSRTGSEVNQPAILKNLKHSSAGKDQLRGFALQGPLSPAILEKCISHEPSKITLALLQKTQVAELQIDSKPVIAARTGYTGEEWGYELYVHPDHLIKIWDLIVSEGKQLGLIPCGLAARDSLRTEAGLPLYGHELAGPENVTPAEAGFGGYVKYHKPFFIGRDKLLERDETRKRNIIRWAMKQKGVRKPNPGDPVADRNGRIIGKVTSCSIDSSGRLIGLALTGSQEYEPGTRIAVFALPAREAEEKPKSQLAAGDKVLLPSEAEVLTRFPED